MNETTGFSIISLSVAAVLMTLILCVFSTCRRSDEIDNNKITKCIDSGNEWRPASTIPNPGRSDWMMSCVKPPK